jgi:hypothetical protein
MRSREANKLTSGDEIFTLLIFLSMISLSSQILSGHRNKYRISPFIPKTNEAPTKQNNVNPCLVKLLRQALPRRLDTIICIVNHDLAPRLKEIPYQLFAPCRHLLSQLLRFGALFSLSGSADQPTEGESMKI